MLFLLSVWREISFDICMVLLRWVEDAIWPEIPAHRAA